MFRNKTSIPTVSGQGAPSSRKHLNGSMLHLFGLRSPVIQKSFIRQYATSIVERVHGWAPTGLHWQYTLPVCMLDISSTCPTVCWFTTVSMMNSGTTRTTTVVRKSRCWWGSIPNPLTPNTHFAKNLWMLTNEILEGYVFSTVHNYTLQITSATYMRHSIYIRNFCKFCTTIISAPGTSAILCARSTMSRLRVYH